MLLSCIGKGAFLQGHMLPREPERCKTETAWFRRLGRCCTKDLFVSGPGRTACPGGHACGGTATAVFRRLCRRNVRPPVSLHASPVPPRPRPDPVFPGLGTAQPPKTDGFVLPILLGKQYSALFTTLLKAPVKTITAGKPRPEYSAYPPVSTQIDAKNFRQEKKHTYSPQTQNRCLP